MQLGKIRSGSRWTLVGCLLLLGVPGARAGLSEAAPGVSAVAVTSKVKVPRGVISDVTLARNPDTGDVLVVYESDGRIYATVMKERRSGKFKGRKARPVSGKERIHHRPSALWNAVRRRWTVVWDTGPERLDLAAKERMAGKVALEPSAIRGRELKSRNGKPRGPEIVLDDGNLNLSPQLVLRGDSETSRGSMPGTVVLHRAVTGIPDPNTQVEITLPGPDGVLGTADDDPTATWPLPDFPDSGDRFASFDGPPTYDPPRLGAPYGADGLYQPFTIYSERGTRTASVFQLDGNGIVPGDTTPAEFFFADTHSPGYLFHGSAGDGSGVVHWNEVPGDCFYEPFGRNFQPSGPPRRGPGDLCVPGVLDPHSQGPTPSHLPPAWVLATRELVGRQPARDPRGRRKAEARLYGLAEDGSFEEGPRVATSRKGLLDTFVLVDVGSGRVFVLWAEVRNRRNSRLWLGVVDPS